MDDTGSEPESGVGENVITLPEAQAQLRYVERAIKAGNEDERQAALADGLLTFGVRFVIVWKMLDEQAGGGSDLFRQKGEQALILFASWLKGKELTTRADEPERRALAALQVLEGNSGLANFTHYAAQAILGLPDSHPLRDVEKVRAAVHSQLLRFKSLGHETPWVFAASALGLAYEEQLATDEELIAWEPWAETIATHVDPDNAAGLWGSVEAFYLNLAERDGSKWREAATRARNRIDPSQLSPRERSLSDLSRILALIQDGDQWQAAEQLKEALDSGTFGPAVERALAVKEARVRLGRKQFERVLALLEPRLDQYEEAYVTAIRTEDRDSSGDEFCEACMTLAFARAAVDRWEGAVEAIERGKCARQRYLRALRRTPRATELLELEAELYATSRGLPPGRATRTVERVQDWLAQGLSPEAELQEQYRRLIPTLDASTWRAPRMSDIQEGLREGEAALSLGLAWPGLMAAVIVRDHPTCLHTIRRPEVTEASLVEYLSSNKNGDDGFMVALERADGEEGPRKTLVPLLEFLDDAIGRPVADLLREHGITRLVVIPHRFLRLTPLWALASWVDLDVRIVPDASTLADSESGQAMARSALVVTNPTLNLQMAATEGAITTARLADSHFDVRVLAGAEASEDAIVERLQGVGLLHFAGHGHAALTDGSLSALLVSPEWSRAGVESADALVAMANTDPDSPHLLIEQDEGSAHRKIYYEYAKEGTLFVDAVADNVGIAGELWRAGDILVSGSLEKCSLAFLCACSSGLGAISALDEATGLPAALGLAGVQSIVSTGWPVADTLALLFADLFYARALPKDASKVDVLSAVRGSAAALRTMERSEAVERIEALAADAPDAAARFRLRAYARRLRSGSPRPFEHPFEWAAFFVTGAAEIPLAGAAVETRQGAGQV